MPVEFDDAKDRANIAKHGVSLVRAADLEILAFIEDDRNDYGEVRYRAWGLSMASPTVLFSLTGRASCARSAFAGHTGRRWTVMPRRKIDRDDNPEWTKVDFAKARSASELPAHVRAAFPRTRGPQKAPTKIPVSIRLSPEVLQHFKSGGPGWQGRIDEVLQKAAANANRRSKNRKMA